MKAQIMQLRIEEKSEMVETIVGEMENDHKIKKNQKSTKTRNQLKSEINESR